MALIGFENDQVEKLSPFLSRRHVDVPRYGAKIVKINCDGIMSISLSALNKE